MKRIILTSLILGALAFGFTSCSDDNNNSGASCFNGIQDGNETGVDCGGSCQPCATCDDGIQNGQETGIDCGGPDCEECSGIIQKSGLISSNETWTANNIYVLNQKVIVDDGVTLTIEAGTIIKGALGQRSLAAALIIARGAKIMAMGTAENPIVFTSVEDNIQVGQKAGTNLNEQNQGLWGGVLILGRAPGSFRGNVEEVQIEGIPADEDYGLYGGNDPDDNSGVFQYVSIRHGGADISSGNEINGLTLGAVGRGTTINNVEVVANVDDGVEYFGGNVNTESMLVWAQGDDGLDIDQAYSGTISNSVVILGNNSDHAMEIDGPEGDLNGEFTLNNITLIGNADTQNGEYADYRSRAMGASNGVYAYGFPDGKDVELDNNQVAQNYLDGILSYSDWEVVGFDNSIFVEKVATDDNGDPTESKIILDPDFTTRAADWTTQVEMGANTVGANLGDFDWTYAKGKGAF